MNKTKIIATLGPASWNKEHITALIKAGADLFRVNMSHEGHKGAIELVKLIRSINKNIGVILDLQGPRIRTREVKGGSVTLKEGSEFVITTKHIEGSDKKVSTDYADLPKKLKPGQRILMDNGLIELHVKNISGDEIYCIVHTGGTLGDHKGINIPGVSIFKKALTEKDRGDIKVAVAVEADYVALSFVKGPDDILDARKAIQDNGGSIPVIAKIENSEAISNIDAIINISDAIMVARGDMGVELPPEEVPIVQKQIIKKCARAAKPVIVASQMLESMVLSPLPTRAESSDVANAILDGADAVMLSEETASGKYPIESISMMARIIEKAENIDSDRTSHLEKSDIRQNTSFAVSHAAVHLCEDINAKAIITFTSSGSTALMASKWRSKAPIIASVTTEKAVRRVSLYWGVKYILTDKCATTDEMVDHVEKAVVAKKLLKKGDLVVITAGVPIGVPGTTNLIKVHKIS
ncbi:MAG: pyruvate kinase [Candidatus Margulisiibacteriota bacterium]